MAKRKKATILEGELKRLEEIKRLVVIAMFSDDELMERLVLKGGNALDIIYQISTRASVDVDFSMADDFPKEELPAYRERVQRALSETFRLSGYAVFDVKMEERPPNMTPAQAPFWGGYQVEFKLADRATLDRFAADIGDLRRHAIRIGQGQKFLIDISRFEWVAGKEPQEFEGYRIFVYTPAMMVCEKLRAICQQMPEYGPVVNRARPGAPRARDFSDIHTLVTARRLDMALPENISLLRNVFEAKRVPLALLGLIENYRSFHEQDYPAVVATVKAGVTLSDFDVYFSFVLRLVEALKPLWNV